MNLPSRGMAGHEAMASLESCRTDAARRREGRVFTTTDDAGREVEAVGRDAFAVRT